MRILLKSVSPSVTWGLLAWLFLPKALTVAALCFWLPTLVVGIIGFVRNNATSRQLAAQTA